MATSIIRKTGDRVQTLLPRGMRFAIKRRDVLKWMDDIAQREKKAFATCKNPEEEEEVAYQFRDESRLADDELKRLTSQYVLGEARRLLIPTPKFQTEGGAWTESDVNPGRYHLSESALHELRAAIRAEKRSRHDTWLTWLAALTGLVGALTGLFAVM